MAGTLTAKNEKTRKNYGEIRKKAFEYREIYIMLIPAFLY